MDGDRPVGSGLWKEGRASRDRPLGHVVTEATRRAEGEARGGALTGRGHQATVRRVLPPLPTDPEAAAVVPADRGMAVRREVIKLRHGAKLKGPDFRLHPGKKRPDHEEERRIPGSGPSRVRKEDQAADKPRSQQEHRGQGLQGGRGLLHAQALKGAPDGWCVPAVV